MVKKPEMLWHSFDLQPIMDSTPLTQKNMPYWEQGGHISYMIQKSPYT